MSGPGKVPPASVVLRWGQNEGASDRKTTYERKNPSGAINPLEIVRLVTGPTTLGSGRGLVLERETMDAALAIEKNETKEPNRIYITRNEIRPTAHKRPSSGNKKIGG